MSDVLHPEAPEDLVMCTLQELCERIAAVDEHFIVQCVEQGIAHVRGRDPGEWLFTSTAVLRIRKAYRLHRDLDLQIDSLGMVLELLDERDSLRQQIDALQRRLQQWEGGI